MATETRNLSLWVLGTYAYIVQNEKKKKKRRYNLRVKDDNHENPEMLLIHCVIHREIILLENISTVLNDKMKSIISCINANRSNA